MLEVRYGSWTDALEAAGCPPAPTTLDYRVLDDLLWYDTPDAVDQPQTDDSPNHPRRRRDDPDHDLRPDSSMP